MIQYSDKDTKFTQSADKVRIALLPAGRSTLSLSSPVVVIVQSVCSRTESMDRRLRRCQETHRVEGGVILSMLALARYWVRRMVALSFDTRTEASSNCMTAMHLHTLH